MSSRIGAVTGGLPKAFLEIGGETLIHRAVRLVRSAGIEEVTMVTGFSAQMFRDAFPGCHFVDNRDYKSTNTSVSLSLAMSELNSEGGVLVLNGDVYFAEGIIEGMLANPDRAQAAIKRHSLSEEEVKVFVDGDRVRRIGKHLNETLAHGEAFGLYLMAPRFAAYMRQELRLLGNPRIFYEEAMDRLLQAGHEMFAYDVGDKLVQEVDFPEDYLELKKLFS
jgi:choline kinase